jgi:hypothetical protein
MRACASWTTRASAERTAWRVRRVRTASPAMRNNSACVRRRVACRAPAGRARATSACAIAPSATGAARTASASPVLSSMPVATKAPNARCVEQGTSASPGHVALTGRSGPAPTTGIVALPASGAAHPIKAKTTSVVPAISCVPGTAVAVRPRYTSATARTSVGSVATRRKTPAAMMAMAARRAARADEPGGQGCGRPLIPGRWRRDWRAPVQGKGDRLGWRSETLTPSPSPAHRLAGRGVGRHVMAQSAAEKPSPPTPLPKYLRGRGENAAASPVWRRAAREHRAEIPTPVSTCCAGEGSRWAARPWHPGATTPHLSRTSEARSPSPAHRERGWR